jgi:glycosyltransferase involved in cell wall biosynthesis
MPTHNRRPFVPRAIAYFLRQDYPHKELVILDDGDDSVADLIPAVPQVRYVRLPQRLPLGAKRNECVRQARGDFLLHWDDDDWMAPHRIRYQVEALLREGAEVCGLRRMLFYEPATGTAWLYDYPAGERPWLIGGSLLYTRDFWSRLPFPSLQVGEDTRFLWGRPIDRAAVLLDHTFYVALIHPGNTSPKVCTGSYWSRWPGDLRAILGADLDFYHGRAAPGPVVTTAVPVRSDAARETVPLDNASASEPAMQPTPPTYSILMVVHNARAMTQMATLRTLRHCAGQDARLVVVDNASSDGTGEWLDVLCWRGDIDLLRNPTNPGHGPGLEQARRATRSPYLVTLDSDAFPLADDWLPRLRARLQDPVKVAGIRHHRDYIHPSCLMIARRTLDELGLSFLDEMDRPSRLDVAERLSGELKRRGYQIAGLTWTGAQRRGSASEPVYLGSEYEGLIYHQWYTTRFATSVGRPVDDVPQGAIECSLAELFQKYHAEARDVTVVLGVQAAAGEPERLRNVRACLQAMNLQDLPRWRYRIVVVEQDRTPQLEAALAPLADRYVFAYNPGPYNRGWGFNVGARLAGDTGALCLIDADLLAPPDFLRRCLEGVQAGHRALLPYEELVYLTPESTEQAVAHRLAAALRAPPSGPYAGQTYSQSRGVCVCVEPALYFAVGGHDERFRGWGYEDTEFWDRLGRAVPVTRLPGRLYHLYHPPVATNTPATLANQRLYEQLLRAGGPRVDGLIGDPGRYASEGASANPPAARAVPGRRDWENWHRWSGPRIEAIVTRERSLRPGTSHRQRLAEVVAGLGDSLVDVGCGPGAVWPHLEPHRPRLSWAGVDVTAAMVAAARRFFPQVPACQGDAGGLPLGDRSFDVVLLRHVLEHLPPWLMEKALAEAARVARRVVVVDFYIPPVSHGARRANSSGEGILETQWTVADLETPIRRIDWHVGQKLTIACHPQEVDVVWILAPAESARTAGASGAAMPLPPIKFSIILPTYRRPHTLVRTVELIRAQTYPQWELIVVDNAGDGQYRFADERIRVYVHAERPSASYARNQGLRYATGDLVCFFDDDDDMFPTYLERLAAAFAANPRAKMVRCGMVVSAGRVDFSHATPECCLRRAYATPTWTAAGIKQDQLYFSSILAANGWSEEKGDIVILAEVLCRANTDPQGGLRSGRY